MSQQILISVTCPHCQHSLMSDAEKLDDLPVIEVEVKISEKVGKIYLSQVYGSYHKKFSGVDDIMGSIAVFSCVHCHQPFPVIQNCDCQAPLVGMQLEVGGLIKICTRNGCKKHALEFQDVNDAFMLLMKGNHTGLG